MTESREERHLTDTALKSSLDSMLTAAQISIVVLSASLSLYGFDCIGMTTAQAMQCCKSMQCISHHQSHNDCCKTMPDVHVDVGQPTSAAISFAPVDSGEVPVFSPHLEIASSARRITAPFHDPPVISSSAVAPLRI